MQTEPPWRRETGPCRKDRCPCYLQRPFHRRGWRSLLPPFEAGPLHYLSPLPALYQVRLQATSSQLHLETAVQTEGRTDHTERRREGQRGQAPYGGGGRLEGEPADR